MTNEDYFNKHCYQRNIEPSEDNLKNFVDHVANCSVVFKEEQRQFIAFYDLFLRNKDARRI